MNKQEISKAAWVWLLCVSTAIATSDETQRRVRFNEGIVAFTQGNYAVAEEIFNELTSEEPQDAGAWYWLGLCRLQRNEYQGAADAIERVLELEPDQDQVKLDAAIAWIALDQFEKGRNYLHEYLEGQAEDAGAEPMTQFFLGLAEYKLGHYAEAMAALEAAESVTESQEMLANIAWYRGWIHTEQHRPEQAVESFRRVAELTTDVDQQVRALRLAEEVAAGVSRPQEEPGRLQFRVDFGLHHDTNVVLLGDETNLPLDLTTDDDFRFGLSSDIRYFHPVNDQWLLGAGASTYHSWHASLQEFNVQTYSGRLFVNYFATDRMTAGLQYEYDFSLVNNDAFLSRHRLTPSLRYVEAYHSDGTALTYSTFYYSFEDRNYHDELVDIRQDRDGDYHAVGWIQSININQPRLKQNDTRWLQADIGYRLLIEQTQGDDFDMTGHELLGGVQIPLPEGWMLDVRGEWTWEHYWQPNTQDFFKREREDFIQRYLLGLEREFELDAHVTMVVRGEVSWTDDDSNVLNRRKEAIYSYDRLIAGVTVSFLID